jgi:hypothetical protein
MRLAIPEVARQLPLDRPELAVRELASIIGELRPRSMVDLELVAADAVDAARDEGVFLMAVVTPPDAAPALLTGVVLEVPPDWVAQTADLLRDSLEDVGGPDVRETITLDTALGPAVLVQRIPGVEQARAGRPLTAQLQAFVPEPGTGRMVLLTLASPSAHGWAGHQRLFGELVASASMSQPDESFEDHTYRL